MIFLSSQPDEYYFLWQLQLQVYNFISTGIEPRQIHILIGYDAEKGLMAEFQDFINACPNLNIHAYTDTRKSKLYAPSLRWHIIAKHLKKFPELQDETIFHHDSDIVFKSLPDFGPMENDDAWYAADTRSYLSSDYIKSTAGLAIFREMCHIVGVTTTQVEQQDMNAGGAQYLIKKITIAFLEKVEEDSERIYKLLNDHNRKIKGFCTADENIRLIQAWTADMWVIWWAAIFYKQEFRIHPELDFAWADSPIEKLDECKTLHYTGGVDKEATNIFRKGNYLHYSPFFQDLSKIDPKRCSGYLKTVIDNYINVKRLSRIDLSDLCVLITVTIKTEEELENVTLVLLHLTMNYHIKIIVVEYDTNAKINPLTLPAEVEYHFYNDNTSIITINDFKKNIVENSSIPFFAIYNPFVILPAKQMLGAIEKLRNHHQFMIIPYSEPVLKIDKFLKVMFMKIQDVTLFDENENKMIAVPNILGTKVVFVDRLHYPFANESHLETLKKNDPEFLTNEIYTEKFFGNLYHL